MKFIWKWQPLVKAKLESSWFWFLCNLISSLSELRSITRDVSDSEHRGERRMSVEEFNISSLNSTPLWQSAAITKLNWLNTQIWWMGRFALLFFSMCHFLLIDVFERVQKNMRWKVEHDTGWTWTHFSHMSTKVQHAISCAYMLI